MCARNSFRFGRVLALLSDTQINLGLLLSIEAFNHRRAGKQQQDKTARIAAGRFSDH